ncbi:MAG TPA: class I tRNA ligase family protein, partial [Aggregatilineales bacterium]|nr:class I tRNA ligase family protein [Aggregatilineales bacterium]
ELAVRQSEHYFLDLSQTSNDLLTYLDKQQGLWRQNVVSFTRNFIKQGIEGGLRGRAYTRDLDWGVRVPVDGWDD